MPKQAIPRDLESERQMKLAEEIMRENKEVLEGLADGGSDPNELKARIKKLRQGYKDMLRRLAE